ncbi:Phosphatidylinositol 4-kinase stt4 [Savitreella phatthalungensis]
MVVRQLALSRLAGLISDEDEHIRRYSQRADIHGPAKPSRRRVDAFIGLSMACVSGKEQLKIEEARAEMDALSSSWPKDSAVWPLKEFDNVAILAYAAVLATDGAAPIVEEVSELCQRLSCASPDHIHLLIRLSALCHACARSPSELTYSDFVVVVRRLNEQLRTMIRSADQLQDESPAGQWQIVLQRRSSAFVLSWSEKTLSVAIPGDLWRVLADPDTLINEELLADEIVWQTINEHAQLHYDVCNATAFSSSSDEILSNLLHCLCIASLGKHHLEPMLFAWLDNFLIDAADIDDGTLGLNIVQVLQVLATRFQDCFERASDCLRAIVIGAVAADRRIPSAAAQALTALQRRKTQEDLVSSIYSFANHVNSAALADKSQSQTALGLPLEHELDRKSIASGIELADFDEQRALNCVTAIRIVGVESGDKQVAALALSVLLQKYTRGSNAVKCQIVLDAGHIATACSDRDIARTMTFLDYVEQRADDDAGLLLSLRQARHIVAESFSGALEADSFLQDLLRTACRRLTSKPRANMLALFDPIATVLQHDVVDSPETRHAFHNFWFDLVIAGYTPNRLLAMEERTMLTAIALRSPTLALDFSTDSLESDLDSYPTLLQDHEHAQTKSLQDVILKLIYHHDNKRHVTQSLSFAKSVYVNAVALVEGLRAEAGSISTTSSYYERPTLPNSDIGGIMTAVFAHVTALFLVRYGPSGRHFDREIRKLLIDGCSHVSSVRTQAARTIDSIVASNASAFCTLNSVTTLLECITLLGQSCYEEYTDRYSPSYEFKSTRIDLTIVVADSFTLRKDNLELAMRNARRWLDAALVDNAGDLRSLLSSYVSSEENTITRLTAKGKLLAVEYAMKCSQRDQPAQSEAARDAADAFLGELALRRLQTEVHSNPEGSVTVSTRSLLERSRRRSYVPYADLQVKLCSYVARLLEDGPEDMRLLRHLVEIPFNVFSMPVMTLATSLWTRIAVKRPQLLSAMLAEIHRCLIGGMRSQQGLFSKSITSYDPFFGVMEYAPTDKEAIAREARQAKSTFGPHVLVFQFLSSRLAAPTDLDEGGKTVVFGLVRRLLSRMRLGQASDHIFAREAKLRLLCLALRVRERLVRHLMPAEDARYIRLVLDAGLATYACSPRWAFGSDVAQMRADMSCADLLLRELTHLPGSAASVKSAILTILLRNDCERIRLWLDPLSPGPSANDGRRIAGLLEACWRVDPHLTVALARRFPAENIRQRVRALVNSQPWRAVELTHSAELVLGSDMSADINRSLPLLHFWAPASPPSAIAYLLPVFESHPAVVQYAMRSLESHAVEVTFFYVPQIVQSLRNDTLGYISRFIAETAKLSQLFAHQIIWNFDANAFKDDDATIEDEIKPALDRVRKRMLAGLSAADLDFYEKEFRFFGEVTSISGKLKPFIKKSKPEKKAKIDEEMARIDVEHGVYLPSNPDGEVIDIERKSGRPLQSHAKAPFMATFKIKRRDSNIERLQSAIFKVGDDCRQDVLALQLISCFRSIFNTVGLDLYVFPYRVTATAPGCGVIDVLPNSVSRDMLGREAVNALYDYFRNTFGEVESVGFQRARMAFVKSLAAYSVISYLLQFKDRHNGNLMYDDQGHILHIDFGFCFDIAPGGIKFEAAPFKLTGEMVAVMGGGENTQWFRLYQELCIKAYLVSRQYSEQICHMVELMLGSGLPCFKGQTTIRNLRKRFNLDVSEQRASNIMLGLIKDAYKAKSTALYDEFQRLTNGIPY